MPSLHPPFFSLRGACLTMRGGSGPLCTPRSKSLDLASAPHQRALRPSDPWSLCVAGSPCAHLQALRESMAKPCSAPRMTFPSRGKSPKARQGSTPEPPEGDASLPLRQDATPSIGFSATKIDRFATLSWWVNQSYFFLWFHQRKHSVFSIRGSAGLPPRMPQILYFRNQYR